ncbi:MAG: hsaD3 [Acidimicrobiales bacterium]|nr:hsaD3 [Acidimicrobiales bacterium]
MTDQRHRPLLSALRRGPLASPWRNRRSTSHVGSGRSALSLALCVGLLAAAAGCGNGARGSGTQNVRPVAAGVRYRSDTVDELVRVGGGRLHVRCVGSGPTTVVLISGFNDGGDSWGNIEPALSEQARVCSYARFGTGTSDAASSIQTFETSAADLHSLLVAIGQPGPFVVVGHSYGGGEAVTFASQYRSEVEGLVLLDATPVGWLAAGCAVPDDGSEWAASFRDGCPDRTDPTDNGEWLDEVGAFAALDTIDSLGALPLAVVTAADHPFPGLAPSATAQLNKVWDDGQDRWLALSSNAHLVTVDETGHYIQNDRPDVALTQIEGLLR